MIIAAAAFIVVILFTLNSFGIFKKKADKVVFQSSQVIPINVNNVAVIDARLLYIYQGTIDKITKVPGGYSVVFKNNPKEYFMPGGLNVMQMKSSGQTQVKPETVKVGDAITFSSVYNLKTRSWVMTYTAQDLKLLQKAR